MCDLMGSELEGCVLVFAQEGEEAPRDVDIAARMRKRIDGIRIEDGECILNIFSGPVLQDRPGCRFDALLVTNGLAHAG